MPASCSSKPTTTSTAPSPAGAIASSSTECDGALATAQAAPGGVCVLGQPGTATARGVRALLARFALRLEHTAAGAPLAGSYWGEPEAGLTGNRLHARADTPLHSVLHEACHFICMDRHRRAELHTDAGGDPVEECAVCYLSILLADALPGFGRARMLVDMDAWGYSFRLGSARAWFESDAADARAWLQAEGLIDHAGAVCWKMRGESAA